MTISRTIFNMMAAVVLIALTAVPASAQVRARGSTLDCLSDRQIQVAIESGQILSWPKIKRLAGIGSYDEVSDVKVCMIDDVPYYIVNVVSPEGEAAKVALNAIDGTEEVL